MLGNQNTPVLVVLRSCPFLAAASVVTARAAAVYDVITFNCVLLTWSLCCTFHGLYSNTGVTVGAFIIDGGDLHWAVVCFRQTDDRVVYIRCLDAVLCRVSPTAVGGECLGNRSHPYSFLIRSSCCIDCHCSSSHSIARTSHCRFSLRVSAMSLQLAMAISHLQSPPR